MKGIAKSSHQIRLPENADNATFIAPTLFELNNLNDLQREVFGPILHVIRYRADELDQLIDQINAKGYALTGGIHSRIDGTVEHIRRRIEAGNLYVNRNIVGAVVGVQPFGGHGLSGTGPKAGGPFYLQRLSRLNSWRTPPLTRSGQADEDALNRLQTLLQSLPLTQEQKLDLAGSLGRARVHTLRQAEQVLCGPTGEHNVLSWQAPKRVWLYGGSLPQAFAAWVELAGSGITALVSDQHPLAAYAEQAPDLLETSATPASAGISHVVALEELPVELKQTLAGSDGALVRIINAQHGVDVLQLFEETSCSINTTAAGGNAHLMAAGD